MMRHKFRRFGWKLAMLCTLGLPLTGCWDNRPVDYRALVFTLGLSASSKPHELSMLFQFPTPPAMASYAKGSASNTSQSPVADIKGHGKSVAQCFDVAQAQVSRDLYLGQIQLIAVSTHLSSSLLFRALDSLERTGTFDKTPFMFATPQSVQSVVSVKTNQDAFPSLYYVNLFSCGHCQTESLGIRFWQFAADALTPGVDPYLPEVLVNKKSQKMMVSQEALYRHFTYVGSLNPQETMAFSLLKGVAHKVNIYLPHLQATLRAIHGSTHLSVRERRGQVYATFHLNLMTTLEGIGTQTETAAQLAHLSKLSSTVLAHWCLGVLEKTQKLDVDPFGIGRKLDWRYPQEFKRFKHWHNEYPKVHMTVSVKTRINKMGDIK